MAAAYYVLHRRLGADMASVNRFMGLLLLWLVVSAGLTSWQGHLGGLLVGSALALAYAYAPRGGRRVAVQVGACAGLVVLLAVTAAVRVSGTDRRRSSLWRVFPDGNVPVCCSSRAVPVIATGVYFVMPTDSADAPVTPPVATTQSSREDARAGRRRSGRRTTR